MLTDSEREALFKEVGEFGLLVPDASLSYSGLEDRAQGIWLSYAKRALRILVRQYKPRRVTLRYESPYQALLTVSDEAGYNEEDFGAIYIITESGSEK